MTSLYGRIKKHSFGYRSEATAPFEKKFVGDESTSIVFFQDLEEAINDPDVDDFNLVKIFSAFVKTVRGYLLNIKFYPYVLKEMEELDASLLEIQELFNTTKLVEVNEMIERVNDFIKNILPEMAKDYNDAHRVYKENAQKGLTKGLVKPLYCKFLEANNKRKADELSSDDEEEPRKQARVVSSGAPEDKKRVYFGQQKTPEKKTPVPAPAQKTPPAPAQKSPAQKTPPAPAQKTPAQKTPVATVEKKEWTPTERSAIRTSPSKTPDVEEVTAPVDDEEEEEEDDVEDAAIEVLDFTKVEEDVYDFSEVRNSNSWGSVKAKLKSLVSFLTLRDMKKFVAESGVSERVIREVNLNKDTDADEVDKLLTFVLKDENLLRFNNKSDRLDSYLSELKKVLGVFR